jgi:hypothetical protein
MSAAAASLVVEFLLRVGRVRQADEGTEAHLFQLLMVAQVPVIAYFAVRYLRDHPRQSVVVMSMQFIAGIAAMSLLYFLEH